MAGVTALALLVKTLVSALTKLLVAKRSLDLYERAVFAADEAPARRLQELLAQPPPWRSPSLPTPLGTSPLPAWSANGARPDSHAEGQVAS
jgi:hypothetical protein